MVTQDSFKDHFSSVAGDYAKYRPHYPDSLFAALAERTPHRRLAWDCGCGNGQSTTGLARYFDRIIATDPSDNQIAKATPTDTIDYAVASAEHAPIVQGSSVDLILAAQAAHWFDLPRFYAEVSRVAAPGALLALVSYRPTQIEDAAADSVLQTFYTAGIGAYWPPERRHVDEGYASMDFPFPEEAAPDLVMEAFWTLDQLVGYTGTWSAVKECRRITGADPVPDFRQAMAPVWGDPESTKRIFWPLAMRLGRVSRAV